LIATDGSKHSEKAFEQALELAKRVGAELEVVTVEDIRLVQGEALAGATLPVSFESIDTASHAIADAAGRRAAQAGLQCKCHVVPMADPAAAIVRHAKSNPVDLIIVGSHGRTGLRRAMLGSVAEKVVRTAPCSVLVVR
jgi:nucleotide-binding universal stress UspA family protein